MATEVKPNRAVKPIPEGYHTLTPYLYVRDGAKALEFYKKAFGAQEMFRMAAQGGKIGHAEIKIGDSIVMLADEMKEWGNRSPQTLGGNGSSLAMYVNDVDATFKRAVDAGAQVKRPVQNQFYGDRSGTIEDPFGHVWTIATHVEDLSPEEIERRGKAEMEKMAKK
jgi:PhnB protein